MATPVLHGPGVRAGQLALSVTAAQVVAAKQRAFLEIKNTDTTISVYLGATGVTSSTGHLLKAGEAFGFDNYSGAVYAVAASATPTVTYIEW